MASKTSSKPAVVAAPFPLGWALGITFLVLKLCGVITWSWIWVLSPFWIPFAFLGIVLVAAGILWVFAKIWDAVDSKK